MTPLARSPSVYRLRGPVGRQEQTHDLTLGEHRVGTLPTCEIVLAVKGVSRTHALLTVTSEGLVVEDLGSKNGTFVDGQRVVRAALVEGGTVAFGPVVFGVRCVAGDGSLAIRFAAAEPTSLLRQIAAGSPAEVDTPTEPPAPQAPEAAHWLGVVERLAIELSGIVPDLSQGLALLGQALTLQGAALVVWSGRQEPLALAAWGALGDVPSLARLRRSEPTGSGCQVVFLPGPPPVSIAVDLRPKAPRGLVLWGELAGRRSAGSFLRCALSVLAMRMPEPDAEPATRAGDVSDLVFPDHFIAGRSAAMAELRSRLESLRDARHPVLILGETGAGKEVVAATLHASSPRARRPFVTVNCAAIPENLLDAEMFGVARGAATGVEAREGHFGRAEHGTLFLDEIGELSAPLQAKLLRALEESHIQPVGGRPRSIDVWVIAATNVDPGDGGGLRRDLYYRLLAGLVEVPPLRRRREDIPALVSGFLRRFAADGGSPLRGVTTRALDCLCAYPWPGNVRELEHEMQILARLDHGGVIDLDHLPRRLRTPSPEPLEPVWEGQSLELGPRIEALERSLLREAMRRAGGRQTVAARLLGVSRNGLANMLRRLGMRPVAD